MSHRSGAQALGQASAAEPQHAHCLGEGRGHIPSSTRAALCLCCTRLLKGPLLQGYCEGSLRCKALRSVLAHLINTIYRLAAFIIFLLCSLSSPPPPLTPLPPPFPPLSLQSLPPSQSLPSQHTVRLSPKDGILCDMGLCEHKTKKIFP